MKKPFEGFTLIELLVVIGIIAILSTALIVGIMAARTRIKEDLTKAEIKKIEGALARYETDYGVFPADMPNNSSKALLDALKGNSKSDPPRPTYLDWPKNRIVNDEFISPLARIIHKIMAVRHAVPIDIGTRALRQAIPQTLNCTRPAHFMNNAG